MTLTLQVLRIPAAHAGAGPTLGVAVAGPGTHEPTGALPLLRLLPPDRVPARVPLRLQWRGDPLSSPDTLTAEARMHANTVELRIALRRFGGVLHANTLTVPLVQVELGLLEAGRFDAVATVSERWFGAPGEPDDAGRAATHDTRVSFVVVAFDAM